MKGKSSMLNLRNDIINTDKFYNKPIHRSPVSEQIYDTAFDYETKYFFISAFLNTAKAIQETNS